MAVPGCSKGDLSAPSSSLSEKSPVSLAIRFVILWMFIIPAQAGRDFNYCPCSLGHGKIQGEAGREEETETCAEEGEAGRSIKEESSRDEAEEGDQKDPAY